MSDEQKVVVMEKPLPKTFFFDEISKLEEFLKVFKEAATSQMYDGWRYTLKLGGKIFREILEKEPENPHIHKMLQYAEKKMESGRQPHAQDQEGASSAPIFSVKEEETVKFYSSSSSSSSSSSCSSSCSSPSSSSSSSSSSCSSSSSSSSSSFSTPSRDKQEDRSRGEKERDVRGKSGPPPPPSSLPGSSPRAPLDLTGDGPLFPKEGQVSEVVWEALGVGEWERKKTDVEVKFWRIDEGKWEDPQYLPARRKVWRFLEKCLWGDNEAKAGPFHFLMSKADHLDLASLLKVIENHCGKENFRSYGKKLELFFSSRPTRGETIFQYSTRLNQEIQEVEKLKFVAKIAGGEFEIPKIFVLWKLLSAVTLIGGAEWFLQKLINDDDVLNTPEALVDTLHHQQLNKQQLEGGETVGGSVNVVGTPGGRERGRSPNRRGSDSRGRGSPERSRYPSPNTRSPRCISSRLGRRHR